MTLCEVNTSEGKACKETNHCKCDGRKRRARARKSKRGLDGQSDHKVQQTSYGNSSGDSQGANGTGKTGRRKAGTSGGRDVEVITLDDSESDGEMLEEEAELVRLIQRRLGRKRSHVF